MKRANELWEQMAPMIKEIKERSVAYIREQLEIAESNSISFRDENDEAIDGCGICVTYDGGNHPEYAANPYSDVYEVYKKDDNIFIHCEDCVAYPLEYMEWMDIFEVADFIYTNINHEG